MRNLQRFVRKQLGIDVMDILYMYTVQWGQHVIITYSQTVLILSITTYRVQHVCKHIMQILNKLNILKSEQISILDVNFDVVSCSLIHFTNNKGPITSTWCITFDFLIPMENIKKIYQ